MNCRQIERLIALYIEGDLEGKKFKRVTQHLKDCTTCQRFAEELRASQQVLKSLRNEAWDELMIQDLPDRVTERITLTKKVSPIFVQAAFWYRWRWHALGAACALALVAVLISPLRTRQQAPDLGNLEREEHSANQQLASPESPDHVRLGPASTSPKSKAIKSREDRHPFINYPKSNHYKVAQSRKEGLLPNAKRIKGPIQVEARNEGARGQNTGSPKVSVDDMALTSPETLPAWPPTTGTTNVDFPEPPVDQMVIKLVTEDPNIIIVWLIDQKRGEKDAQN